MGGAVTVVISNSTSTAAAFTTDHVATTRGTAAAFTTDHVATTRGTAAAFTTDHVATTRGTAAAFTTDHVATTRGTATTPTSATTTNVCATMLLDLMQDNMALEYKNAIKACMCMAQRG